MPMVLIEIGKKQSQEKEIALMNSVHSALLETFKVTNHAINIRLIVQVRPAFSKPSNCM